VGAFVSQKDANFVGRIEIERETERGIYIEKEEIES
jgi:hypothetical protein